MISSDKSELFVNNLNSYFKKIIAKNSIKIFLYYKIILVSIKILTNLKKVLILIEKF